MCENLISWIDQVSCYNLSPISIFISTMSMLTETALSTSAPAPAATAPVEFDPSTFVPTRATSSHFEFVRPDLKKVDPFLSTVKELQTRNPPEAVATWLESQVAEAQKEAELAEKVADEKNGRELAKRVVHKFLKWGPVRFGKADNCKRDFYDGSQKVASSSDATLALEPGFENAMMEQALAAGVDGTEVLSNLHVGVSSLKRFAKWMALAKPTSSD